MNLKPTILQVPEQSAAVIHLQIPAAQCQKLFGPAVQELLGALKAQKMSPAGPLFSHHLELPGAQFNFEIGFPVKKDVQPSGRVRPGKLPAAEVAQAEFIGPYEDLPTAWGALRAYVAAQGRVPQGSLWEAYQAGPDADLPPAQFRTLLCWPLQR